MVQRAVKFPTVMAVDSREYGKGFCLGGNRILGTGLKKVLYGDVYSSARELMHQLIGKYHTEGSHLKQC